MPHNHVAKHLAARTQRRVENEWSEVEKTMAGLRADAKARGAELLKEARDRGQKAVRSSGEWIGENPAQAVGIAFAVGLIARGWLRRKSE